MRSVLNDVLVKKFNYCKNLKYRRFISGKCEIKNMLNTNNVINTANLCTRNEEGSFRGSNLPGHKKGFSTFMKNVIEQVKKDMKENKQYQEALKELKEKTEIDDKAIKLKKKIEDNINFFKNMKEKNAEAVKILYSDVNNFVTYCFENYYALKFSKNITVKFLLTLKKYFTDTTNRLIELTDKWNDHNAFAQLEKWRQEMAIRRYKKNVEINEKKSEHKIEEGIIKDSIHQDGTTGAKSEDTVDGRNNVNDNTEGKSGNELILAYESAWDKFGSKLKDMPFLNNFFENPILGKLFGETELAAALREMKMHDKNFKLSELMYLFEYVISKHIVESYLIGDEETLRLHCGQSAFNSLNASITERKKKKVFLDTNVLIYKNHELKGAQRMEESSPWFIFTFHTQQINCLKNKNDEIIEGKIDDIREVVYTIALSKHPEPEKEGLLYPYIVREFAIIGNTPSW
ncbi:mitochondrial import inner membrane translocase subunit TIM44, putative (TIM44) [Plasmodium ovale wallikeri]|uniref:Mitochondrial import inner membrane translocase subunit TIM44, putative n=2 Tax=Plasmodium ovale TaxID=36330 RepID=A0A1C3KSL0_PLAOA|nr:mitochondrial import inner membrane translocase subunit TIM44, putative (TIM44) [Plasmodium ovale wallikeri]SBT35798.1 mitochondrial import inner membrane translocase subunit TIM44, putative (TIM44) [Plasmodium ovale wallikeri]SBT77135.1 mitochondrial import inner membrane translocase subunit TIM44, putative [Plasmodium ovale]